VKISNIKIQIRTETSHKIKISKM